MAIREGYDNYASSVVLLSHNLEKVADIPAPQYEIEHGLKEDYKMCSDYIFVADGTVYTKFFRDYNNHYLYRLNIDTCEWENLGEHNVAYENCFDFFGKYFSYNGGIYDRVTGEQVFECGGLYCPANSYEADTLCYFGGNKYLGRKGDEYRWVNLTDMSMSGPLPFPEGEVVTVLDDTYCVYRDKYGWFLWNYNTGEEEIILAFDN